MILDLVRVTVVIEIICCYIPPPIRYIRIMVMFITGNFFRAVTAARRGLTVQSRQGIPVIICVLQIIVHLNIIVVIAPSTGYRYAR